MAVERKTFLWIGNDRSIRSQQIQDGITSGITYGASTILNYNYKYTQSPTPGNPGSAGETSGGTAHQKALDEFWNNKENWAERLSGFSGGDGISGEDYAEVYYGRASRIPHRGDNVVFEYVKGSTANGLLRTYVGSTDGGLSVKPFDAPLSPCLFGGYAQPGNGVSGEGSVWVNADNSGSSAANRRGPLASVKVYPSYFHRQLGVISKATVRNFSGFAQDFNWSSGPRNVNITKHWGGRVSSGSFSNIAGASFGGVTWAMGNTGINLRALDVQINTPYRMPKVSDTSAEVNGVPLFPETITNADGDGGETINLRAGNYGPRCEARLGYADNIVNLNVGAKVFIQYGGSVHNVNISDAYLPFMSDEERKERAENVRVAPEKLGDGNFPRYNSFTYVGTVTNQLRCDPCWFTHITDFVNTVGNPDIRFGPFFAGGLFYPRVTAAGTVESFPSQITSLDTDADEIRSGNSEGDVGGNNGPQLGGYYQNFCLAGSGNDRFAVTTIDMKEFNPRWDVVTYEGAAPNVKVDSSTIAVRGFNNQIGVQAGCTITNLNMDAGVFRVDQQHPGGDTFDDTSEVGDVVILNGYAEEKAFLRGEHPTISSFNAFYIGKGGVSETGNNFQIRNRKAEFDFGPGVYLRSGPATTGITGAGYKFVQAPRATTKP